MGMAEYERTHAVAIAVADAARLTVIRTGGGGNVHNDARQGCCPNGEGRDGVIAALIRTGTRRGNDSLRRVFRFRWGTHAKGDRPGSHRPWPSGQAQAPWVSGWTPRFP